MHPGMAVAASGAAFWGLHQLTVNALDWAQLDPNVHWIYLPSGVRLAATLLLGWPACVGITLATLITAWPASGAQAWGYAAVTALISGFSPLLAQRWGSRWLDIPHDLSGLSSRSLMMLAALFAIISATLHQGWFWLVGLSGQGLTAWMVMATGDFVGALVVLVVMGWLLVWWEKMR